MQPLTFFPLLMSYDLMAPLMIRVMLGITLIYFGYRKTKGTGQSSGSNSVTYGRLEVLIGIFLVIGLFTQLCALINVVILGVKIWLKIKEKKFLTDGVNYYLLLLVMALSLLFLEPGFLSVDMVL